MTPFRRPEESTERCTVLGESEQGRPLFAAVVGDGARTVSLVAGAHSDEPVGPEMLRRFLLEEQWREFPGFRFVVVPHLNPDGEARNREWIDRWPDLDAYRAGVFREPPGRDLEFGYPDLRIENRLVAALWREHAPFALHMSLHGMVFSEGAMLLLERHWIERTASLRAAFVERAAAAGLRMHDHDRGGEKGFRYIAPGFTTTPEGEAMRRHFRALGDDATAALFRESSMEFVRALGGDPLCVVTELPLWVVENPAPEPGVPGRFLELMARGPDGIDFEPLPLETSVRLQRAALELSLAAVS